MTPTSPGRQQDELLLFSLALPVPLLILIHILILGALRPALCALPVFTYPVDIQAF
jgi:hypothetical protein